MPKQLLLAHIGEFWKSESTTYPDNNFFNKRCQNCKIVKKKQLKIFTLCRVSGLAQASIRASFWPNPSSFITFRSKRCQKSMGPKKFVRKSYSTQKQFIPFWWWALPNVPTAIWTFSLICTYRQMSEKLFEPFYQWALTAQCPNCQMF